MANTRSTRTGARARARTSPQKGRSTPSRSRAKPPRRAPRGKDRIPLRAWLPLAAVLALAALGWSLYPTLRPLYEQQRQVTRLERELEGLQERNADLRKQVRRLKTPAGVEEAARSSLGYVRPGEKAYVVIDSSSSAEASASAEETRGTWWHGLYEALFGGAE